MKQKMIECPKCRAAIPQDSRECPKCLVILEKFRNQKRFWPNLKISAHQEEITGEFDKSTALHLPINDNKINLIALAVCILIAWWAQSSLFLKLSMFYWFSIPIHEMGHTVFGWINGMFCIPIGAFIPMASFTACMSDPKIGTSAFVVIGSSGLAVFSYLRNYFFRSLLFSTIAAASLYSIAKLSMEQKIGLMVLGGLLGEIIFSAILIISFFFNISNRIRWDFFRYPVLLIGCFQLMTSSLMWYRIKNHQQELPLGSMMNGRDDATGDIQRLIFTYGWQTETLIHFCHSLSVVCVLVCLGIVVSSVVRNRKV